MRVFRRRAFGLAIPLLTLFSLPAHSQNLLINPGFDRDLAGWNVRTEFYPPANVDASAQWEAVDALDGGSGSVRFSLHGGRQTVNRVQLTQCFAATPGRRYTGGGLVRTDDELQNGVFVNVELFSTTGCTGDPVTSSSGGSLLAFGFTHVDSGGLWLPATASAPAGADARSVRYSAGIYAVTGSYYSSSSFDGLFDDAYLVEDADPAATWILPAAGRGAGAAGSLWTTTLALANPGLADGLVTLKFLFHDADGRSGPEKTVYLRAGGLLEYPDVLGTLFARTQDYGAIRITSSSASLVVQSETSTPSLGGTVGQALPAFDASDFAGATPKSLAPIRENASFRTNLVLTNPTEVPVTAHVVLYAADGTQIGARDVDLLPLGMTQINRVASALGAASLDAGRVSVSTATPGGLIAAYASVIDNVTNDPHTLLPQDGTAGPPTRTASPNLLVNPGFDRDLTGWTARRYASGGTPTDGTFVVWDAADASRSTSSGSGGLHAQRSALNSDGASVSQCVQTGAGTLVRFGAKFLIRGQKQSALAATMRFYGSADCTGAVMREVFTDYSPPHFGTPSDSGGTWLPLESVVLSPAGTGSATIDFVAWAQATREYGMGWADVSVDDAFLVSSPVSATSRILPSAGWLRGAGGALWVTSLSLVNSGPADAAVTLRFLPHDGGSSPYEFPFLVRTGQTMTAVQWDLRVNFEGSYGAILMTASTPSAFLQSETSTVSNVGTVGQALPALGAPDFATATPKALTPIRENASFRTNLVLANPTEIPVTAHVALFAADGTQIGSRDVDLPPLGMTQINRVASALGATTLDAGRISISTPTPGGLVAAYASVIDNVTNDPRTLLPR